MSGTVRYGSCSWKYPSWHALVYSSPKGINYLEEYAKHYDSVEIDQWFWSLFGETKVVLPKPETVAEYASSVGDDFTFTVKAPNSITLTHLYKQYSGGKLTQNPYFLSIPLLEEFLSLLDPIKTRLGPIMFQFEYLNKRKMESIPHFIVLLADFFEKAPKGYSFALEPRNPQIFRSTYFDFLNSHGLYQVFLQGYYMPEISTIYEEWKDRIVGQTVIRLHGYDRLGIEEKTKKKYDRIVEPMDAELPGVISMIQDLRSKGVTVFLNVNNHYEGSAPLSIEKIKSSIRDVGQ